MAGRHVRDELAGDRVHEKPCVHAAVVAEDHDDPSRAAGRATRVAGSTSPSVALCAMRRETIGFVRPPASTASATDSAELICVCDSRR